MPSTVQQARKLVFPQQLLQPGKQSGGGDALQSRLKELHGKLAALDQDQVDVESLQSVRKPLISNVILHHKDRGVKAYAACCLADMLKLFAPEPPYSAEELRDIFQFFHEQIMANFKPLVTHSLMTARSRTQSANQAVHGRITEIPYYQEYCYLLESLATIKSIVLVVDVPTGDQLVVDFFEGFLKIVRADMSKNIIRHMADILMALIDEAQPLPAGVMDCLIGQFEKFGSKPDTPSFMLAVDVVNGTADKLQRLVLAHFSEIQLSHGRDPSDEDIETLESSHDLMLTMFTYTPSLLDNVIPQLEDALRAIDEAPLRSLTTQTLGRMFATRAHTPDGGDGVALARAFPATWKGWLGRRGDKVVEVRLAWCKTAREILENHPDLRDDLEPALRERCTDPDEKVRAAACKLFGEIDYETALHFVSLETLKAVAGRLADKKSSVRANAFGALRRLYSLAYSEIETNEQEAVFKFAWIPAELLLCMFSAPSAEVRTMVDNSIYNDILPLPAKAEDEAAWVDRLLLVVSHLPPRALTALISLMNLTDHAQRTSPHGHFLRACEMNNVGSGPESTVLTARGGIIDENEQAVKKKLNHIATMMARNYFVDSNKALKDILSFAAINDRRLYKLFNACIDPSSDLNTVIKSKTEFLKRIGTSNPEILDTCAYLLQRGSFFLLNRSSVSTLLQRVQSSEQPKQAEAAITLLRHINKACPVMHKTHVAELVKAAKEGSRPELVELALQGLAHVCKTNPEVAPNNPKLAEEVIEWVSTGTPRQAKFATRYLIMSDRKDGCPTLLTHIDQAKCSVKDQQLLAILAALAEIARFAPEIYETASVSITEWIFKDILWAKSSSAGEDLEDLWVEEDELLFGDRAKLAAIRVCTNRAYAARKADNALQSMLPVLRMLDTIMAESGGLKDDTEEGGKARCHLRLRAGLSLLKLGSAPKYDKYLANGFEAVAFLVQDPCFQVRNAFLRKLLAVLPRMGHPPRWNIVPVLTAHDPEAENMSLGRQIVTVLYRQTPMASRIKHLDLQLARLLSLLAHHPDFSKEAEDLKSLAKYIEFYLDLLGNADNIGLLYTVAGMLKSVRDASEGYPSENIYFISELAQIIIKGRAEAHSWTLSIHPEKLQLPRDAFRPHASPEAAQQIAKTTYLPDETVKFFGALGRKAVKEPAPKRPKAPRVLKPKKTVKTEGGGKSKSKKTKTKGNMSDDEDESSSSDSESSEEEEEEEEEEDDAEEEIVPVPSRKRASPDSDEEGRPDGRGGKRVAKTKPVPRRGKAVKTKTKVALKKQAHAAGSESSELSEIDSD